MIHEKRIEVRWRDCDAYGHVNNAVYATYLEECRDEWLEAVLGEHTDTWDFVLARVAIDFRREVRLEHGHVVARTSLVRIGRSSFALREEVVFDDGTTAAEAEAVIVARDREAGGSRPLTHDELERLERVLADE